MTRCVSFHPLLNRGEHIVPLPWLIAVSLVFVALERLAPWRKDQALLRPGLARDVAFLFLNANLLRLAGILLVGAIVGAAADQSQRLGVAPAGSPLAGWPFPLQLLALVAVADFLEWCIHNLLHRVPVLWTFHKVHHSIRTMDWIGSLHFHWMEHVVYGLGKLLPLAWLGAPGNVVGTAAVLGLAWGHLNHANLDVSFGRLGYVLNSPRMHLWHHDHSDEGGFAKNFGVVFSAWDWIFGTAYWPRTRSPERLGYPRDEEMPSTLVGQMLWPVHRV